MATLAMHGPHFWRRLTPRAARRGLIAGATWGLTMGAGLTVLGLWDCNVVCLTDLGLNTGIAVAAGILTIGPLAAFGARSAAER